MSGGCCSNPTILTLSGTGPTTLCNLVIDTWVDVAYHFMTGSIAVPASASPRSMPAAPITVSNAGAVFSSLANAMSSYLSSLSRASGLPSNKTASATVAASSTTQPTPTVWVMTTVSGYAFCSSGHDTAGLSTTTIDGTTSSWCATPGATAPSSGTTNLMRKPYCTCGAVIAPLLSKVIADTTSFWCPTPGVVIPTGPPTSSVAQAALRPTQTSPTSTPTTAPTPTPSIGAFETWREDSCDDIGCTSSIYGWDLGLAPAGQVIDPCTNSKYTYNDDFAQNMQNDNSSYTIIMTGVDTLGYKGMKYLGSNDGYYEAPNIVTWRLVPSDRDENIFCQLVLGAVAKSCSVTNSLDEDNWTPISYCLR